MKRNKLYRSRYGFTFSLCICVTWINNYSPSIKLQNFPWNFRFQHPMNAKLHYFQFIKRIHMYALYVVFMASCILPFQFLTFLAETLGMIFKIHLSIETRRLNFSLFEPLLGIMGWGRNVSKNAITASLEWLKLLKVNPCFSLSGSLLLERNQMNESELSIRILITLARFERKPVKPFWKNRLFL